MYNSNRIIFLHGSETTCLEYCAQSQQNTKGITIASLNICSIIQKLDDLKVLQKSKMDILTLNETFLNNSIEDNELQISGYRAFRMDHTAVTWKTHGGGVMIYCSDDRDVRVLDNGAFCTPNIESIWLEMKLPNSKPTIICSVYRPPDSKVEDIRTQYDNLEISHRHDIIMIGDLNVDLTKGSTNKTKLTTFMKSNKLEQLITKSTRITEQTSTLIDHIWCNNSTLYAHRGVIETGLSDHSLIFCCRKCQKLSKAKKMIEIRSRRNFDPTVFEAEAIDTDWSEIFLEDDVDIAANLFQSKFMLIVDKQMPVITIRTRIHQSPWVSSEFL